MEEANSQMFDEPSETRSAELPVQLVSHLTVTIAMTAYDRRPDYHGQ
jgi:hypothetical protein